MGHRGRGPGRAAARRPSSVPRRCRAAAPEPGSRRAAPSRSRDDRRAGHPPVPQQTAADAGPAARDHVPGVRDPGGDVRERGGVRADGLDRSPRCRATAVPVIPRCCSCRSSGRRVRDRGAVRCPVPHPLTPLLAIGGLAMLTAAAALLTRPEPGERQRGRARGREFGADRAWASAPRCHRRCSSPGSRCARRRFERVFALVELLRGVTAFLVAPVLLYLATAIGTSLLVVFSRLGLDLPGHRHWRCAAGHAPVRARQRPEYAGPGAMGRRRTRVDVPAAARPAEAGTSPRGTCPPSAADTGARSERGRAVKGLLLLSQSFRSARAWFAGRRAEL